MSEQQVSTNKFSVSTWIVDSNGIDTGATHTTITAAMASASSGDTIYVKTGTYTEDFTIKAGITLTSPEGSGFSDIATIIGKITFTDSGNATVSSLRVEGNSDYSFVCSGTSSGRLNINNCYLRAVGAALISLTNANREVYIFQGYQIFASGALIDMSAGKLFVTGVLQELGIGTCLISGGTAEFYNSRLTNLYSLTNSADINFENCVDRFGNTIVTLADTSTGTARNTAFGGGSNRCLEIGAGCTFTAENCTLSTTVADSTCAGGAGTFNYSALGITGGQGLITATTATGSSFATGEITFDAGTNYLNNYTEGTFTPTITGSSGAPTITYTTQLGVYTRIGDVVHLKFKITINTISGGSGNVRINTLPVAAANDSLAASGTIRYSGINLDATTVQMTLLANSNSTELHLIQNVDDGAEIAVALSTLSAGDILRGTITYWV